MKNLFIVGNWKSNKTTDESRAYLEDLRNDYTPRENVTVIICPSSTSVKEVSDFVGTNGLNINIGVQNISEYEEGAYTGEISAQQAAEFAKFVIVGHSEIRRLLGETDEQVDKKVKMAKKYNLTPIVCVINDKVPIPQDATIVAYEPIEAIGTGNSDTPRNAQIVASQIKSKNPQVTHVLYGGSVASENVRSFTEMPDISGVLVGGASLDPHEFSQIIKNT